MKDFLNVSEFPLPLNKSINVLVWQDYDALDHLFERMGYKSVEPYNDEHIDQDGLRVGMQNRCLHSGWIATMGDNDHVVQEMITLLNLKVERVKERGEELLVGFSRTGHFSVGYSIYVKRIDKNEMS